MGAGGGRAAVRAISNFICACCCFSCSDAAGDNLGKEGGSGGETVVGKWLVTKLDKVACSVEMSDGNSFSSRFALLLPFLSL